MLVIVDGAQFLVGKQVGRGAGLTIVESARHEMKQVLDDTGAHERVARR